MQTFKIVVNQQPYQQQLTCFRFFIKKYYEINDDELIEA